MSVDWRRICSIDDIPVCGARVLRADGIPDIAVFRTEDDRVFAVRDRCPHKGGPLSQGIVHGARVTCPLHAWVIDLRSGAAVEPDIGATPCFSVRCVGRDVFLRGDELTKPAAVVASVACDA